jgi:hypothetical protein
MGFLNKLFQGDAGKKVELVYDLGKVIGPEQILKIQKYLNDGNVEVRRAALNSLEQQWPTGDAVGISALTQKLQDSDAEVRACAALALGEFIPCAKTPSAAQKGSAAVMVLLDQLKREPDETVLSNIFTALGNLDDPNLVTSFSEIAKKLPLTTLYVGIRNIGSLRPTATRSKMVSILQAAETGAVKSAPPVKRQAVTDYHGVSIKTSNTEILLALEEQIGSKIPIVTSVNANTFGALIEKQQVVELGLYKRNLASLPENIGQLTALRVLYIDNNKIENLPDSLGELKSLQRILMQWNEITSLPNTIVNLNNLGFIRLDNKIKPNISPAVAKWLEKLEKKLGPNLFLWN